MREFFLRKYDDPLVQTERLKLLAGGAQLTAISTLVGFFLAPAFNAALAITWPYRLLAVTSAILLEVAAMTVLSYLPPTNPKGR